MNKLSGAKIAGIKMCQAYRAQYGDSFISVMPANLYGPNDNYDLETSHVMPAMIRKLYLAARLERDDWDAIREDLNKRPVNGVDGQAAKEDILQALQKHGISVLSSMPTKSGPPVSGFRFFMGHRQAQTRIPARRRPGRRLPLSHG